MRSLGIVLACAICLGGAGAALAQDPGPACREVRAGEVACDPIDVEGRPHEPRAFVLVERARVRHEARPLLERDLTREIRRSVRRAPF